MSHLFEEIYIKSNKDRSLEDLLEEAKQAYKYLLDGNKFYTKKGLPVRFTDRGFNEFFFSVESVMNDSLTSVAAVKLIKKNTHELDALLDTVQNLQEIVENMDFVFYQKNKKPDKKPFLRGIEYYECPVIINGKKRKVKLAFEKNLKDKSREARYYYHFLEQKEIPLYEINIVHFELL
jgi:hypothetical protein